MKFITDLFKPKNEINVLFEKARKKREKENAAQLKKTTAYLNKLTRRVMWNRKKEKLATVPVIKFFLKIVKYFTPVKKEGLFSRPEDMKVTFTSDEINKLFARAVDKRNEEMKAKRKENAAYLRRINKKVKMSEKKKD
jgi:hypothetical protein